MESTVNYLRKIFGKEIRIEYNEYYNTFPMYMTERYKFCFIKLPNDDKTYVLIKTITKQNINIIQLKKQMKQIYSYSNSMPVFVFDSLRLSQRNALIQNGIPFIQPENQVFIPSIMINLSQKEIVKEEYEEVFSIATQVTYIYILLNHIKETNAPRLAKEIPYSKITLNRALAELVGRGLLYTNGNNTRKMYKTIERNEFWEEGKKYLFNPVEKVYYISEKKDNSDLFISGETALARLGNSLNETKIDFYACTSETIKRIKKKEFINWYDIMDDNYLTIEQYKYNPHFLSKNNYVDVISLYAELKDSDDERIHIALDELLEEVVF